MECPSESGCVCVLGILNHFIGLQSESVLSNGKYSGVDFCETNLLRSICSRRINQGAELRWITAMTHWVFFIQQYNDGNGWTYLDELHEFVSGGMVDVSFVGAVADLSVLDTEATTSLDSSKQRFVQNFFKAMINLSEGMSQSMTQPEIKTATPTTPPSKRTTPVQTLAPTPGPRTASPSNPPTTTVGLISILNPTHKPTDKPVSPTNPPSLSTRGGEENFLSVAADNSSPPTVSSDVATNAENSQLPFLSADNSSPPTVSSDVAMNAENSQQPVLSSDDSSPSTVSSNIATTAENSQPSVLYPSATPVGSSSLSPTTRQHWEYKDESWYRTFFSPSREQSKSTRSNVCDGKRIMMVMIIFLFIF